jgi:uncharacterized membrane protein (UPF0127 family)
MRIEHRETNTVLGEDIRVFTSFIDRLRGLMFRRQMVGDGLIIAPCTSIHNCFVFFPIDAVFIDNDYKIIKILRNFKPWRFSWIYLKARKVIELPDGKVPLTIKVGDQLEVSGV